MMQAPAAPQHELMVQEDGRDWALEQMAQAAAPSAAASADPSAQQTLFEDISAGEGIIKMPAPIAAVMTHLGLVSFTFHAVTVEGSSKSL